MKGVCFLALFCALLVVLTQATSSSDDASSSITGQPPTTSATRPESESSFDFGEMLTSAADDVHEKTDALLGNLRELLNGLLTFKGFQPMAASSHLPSAAGSTTTTTTTTPAAPAGSTSAAVPTTTTTTSSNNSTVATGAAEPARNSSCIPPQGECDNAGWRLVPIQCDVDQSEDMVCLDAAEQPVSVYLSSEKCQTAHAISNAAAEPALPALAGALAAADATVSVDILVSRCAARFHMACHRPVGWCASPGFVMETHDCDGDGRLDLTCHSPNDLHGTILSSHECHSTWPMANPFPLGAEGCRNVTLKKQNDTELSEAQLYTLTRWGITEVANFDVQYCYKPSYGRGVGTPMVCPPELEQNGALCYPKCRSLMHGVGPVCWGQCPQGFSDTGIDCLKPSSYGRGVGRSCLHGFFKCDCNDDEEKNGLMCYPKCRPGFHSVGCCVCSPDCPDGLTDIGVSCQKKTYGRGAGEVLSTCPSGKEKDAALCYTPCNNYTHGVGPVCWGQCGFGQPDDCAAGCAKTHTTCVTTTINMVVAPIVAAVSIATLGAGSGASSLFKAGTMLGSAEQAIKSAYEAAKPLIEAGTVAASAVVVGVTAVRDFSNALKSHVAEILGDRLAAAHGNHTSDVVVEKVTHHMVFAAIADVLKMIAVQLVMLVDPTGLSGVFYAFAKPLCKWPTDPPALSQF